MKGKVVVLMPTNHPPSVIITNPASGTMFVHPASITGSAEATDSDGSVTKVEFFAGQTPVGVATNPPYPVVITNLLPAIYALTAVATDDMGAEAISDQATDIWIFTTQAVYW